jgi:hypothetical protein
VLLEGLRKLKKITSSGLEHVTFPLGYRVLRIKPKHNLALMRNTFSLIRPYNYSLGHNGSSTQLVCALTTQFMALRAVYKALPVVPYACHSPPHPALLFTIRSQLAVISFMLQTP